MTPSGKPASTPSLQLVLRCEGALLARFQDERVPDRDRVGQEPEWGHHREVERRHHRENTERFTHRGFVDPWCCVLKVSPLHHRRNPTGDLDVLDATTKLSTSLLQRLLVLSDNVIGDFRLMRFEQLIVLEEGLDSLLLGCRTLGIECIESVANCVVDVRTTASVKRRELVSRSRVRHRMDRSVTNRLHRPVNLVLDVCLVQLLIVHNHAVSLRGH